MQGYPVAEAARILDVPTGTVKSRCARGRAKLLPMLTHLRTNAGDNTATERGRNRTPGAAVPPAADPRHPDPDAVKGGGGRP